MLSSSDGAEGTPLPVEMMVKLTSSTVFLPALPQVTGTAVGAVVTSHGPATTDYPITMLEGASEGAVFIESIEMA